MTFMQSLVGMGQISPFWTVVFCAAVGVTLVGIVYAILWPFAIFGTRALLFGVRTLKFGKSKRASLEETPPCGKSAS